MMDIRKKILKKLANEGDLPTTDILDKNYTSQIEYNKFDNYFKNKTHFFAELRSLISEINGDFRTLKEKGIGKKIGLENIKILNNLSKKLYEIYSGYNINLLNPYIWAEEIVKMVKKEKSRLELLNSIIQKHLDEEKVGLGFQKYIIEAQVNSIYNIIEFAKKLEEYLKSSKGYMVKDYPEHEGYITEEFERTKAPAEEATGVFIPSKK